MRTLLTALFGAALLASATTVAAAAVKPSDDNVFTSVTIVRNPLRPRIQAPADEYFGRQKISNLGIRNILHDMTIEGTSPLALPKQMGRIGAIQSALTDWLEKYPSDRWLPGEMIGFARFLETKQEPFADNLAAGYFLYVRERYVGTPTGSNAAKILDGLTATPPFDMSDAPMQDPHDNVGDYLFPRLK